MKSIGLLLLVATVILLPLGMIGEADDLNPAAASSPRQGLLGHYYTPHLGDTWIKNDFSGLVKDPYGVSVPAAGKQPDAARVDSQIAFGKGVGFSAPRDARVSPEHASQVVWWPEELVDARPGNSAGAVIWKGYIRLPKAGTYYLATATHGATAVYLNQGRVALKGPRPSSGTIQSEAFSYPETETGEPVQEPSSQYLVPITIDSPRDFPLEVRYTPRHGRPVGIDLYWVTPDSLLDAEGKPIARIVPAEVLFVDPPGAIDTVVTRSESSMISSEFLYFSPATQGDEFTLTIRLADEKGQPVPGKRVHVSGLVSSGQADIIIQPENPTDDDGVTTARVRAGPGYRARHESTFHAADVTDFVDVGQVAHVQFDNTRPSFLPQTYAPYYDDKKFLVEPLPLTIGQPVTIKVPLTNTTEADAELTVIFRSNELNIGVKEWPEIDRVSGIKLRPGESTEASIEWTPRDRMGKRCFRIDLLAEFPQRRSAFLPLAVGVAWAQEDGPSTTLSESLQRNIGMVGPPESPCDEEAACETVADMRELLREHDAKTAWPGSYAGFTRAFDPLLGKLSNKDLACRLNKGSDPIFAELVGQIHRDRFGLKTVDRHATFPSLTDCSFRILEEPPSPGATERCEDYDAIERIDINLNSVERLLNCPMPESEPGRGSGPCPSGGANKAPGDDAAIQQVIDGVKQAIKDTEKGLRKIEPGSDNTQRINTARGKIQKLKQYKAYWDNIRAASCIPLEIPQLVRSVLGGDKSMCNRLCHETGEWFGQLYPGPNSDFQKKLFKEMCMIECN